MKKIFATLLSIMLIIGVLPIGSLTASAATSGYYTYTVSSGEATITDCDESISGSITIPDTLGGYPVTSIGDRAFSRCTSLTSIIIPNSITSIDNHAFSSCTRLTSITIPDSVMSIGDNAFNSCVDLTSVSIPASVTSIGDYVFFVCDSLTNIIVDDNNNYYSSMDGVLFNKDKTAILCYPEGKSETSYIIPASVTSVGYAAFVLCPKLTNITIPDSVINIGDDAFLLCSELVSITISNSVTSIGNSAFYGCTRLANVHFCGTEEQWNKISIDSDNSPLIDATRSYADYSDWQIRKEATCTENGEKYRVCSICENEETETIPALSHKAYNITTANDSKYPFELNDGIYSSTNKNPNSSSIFTLRVFMDTTLEIEYKTSSEGGWDKLRILHNSAETIVDSGINETWKSVTLNLSAGDRVYIKYTKDGSVNKGDDTVYFKLLSEIFVTETDNLEANCSDAINCIECGNEIKPTNDNHRYSNDCDEYCDFCNEYRTVTHIASSECDEYCDSCSAYLYPNVSHAYDNDCDENCDLCDEWRDAPHITSSDCDEYCNLCGSYTYPFDNHTYDDCFDSYCNYCDEYRYETGHIYDGDWDEYCNQCGEYRPIYVGCDHWYDSDCDEYCNGCGEWRGMEFLEVHTYDDCYDCYCNYCDEYRYAYGHVYDDDLDEYCNQCGEYRPVYVGCEHQYDNDCDPDCNYCDEVREIQHTYDNYQDIECNVCGSVRYLSYSIQLGVAIITGCDTSISGSITIPDTIEGYPVTHIDTKAFYNCDNLTSVIIPDSVISIGYRAFYYCTSLISITISNSVTSIGDSAFYWCTSLISITIPQSVTSIGDQAFYGCSGLTSVTIGAGVTGIGNYVFAYCSSLTSITVVGNNNSFSSLDGVLFNKNKTTLIYYPEGKTETSYTIPESVTSIGDGAFYYCQNLINITIPDSVTSIGRWTFYYCSRLTSISISENVTSIGDNAFDSCLALTNITVDDNNTTYSSIDGVLFNINITILICYPAGKTDTSYTIPDSVITINSFAFADCHKLTNITIGNGVTSIGERAFDDCYSLTSINISDTVTSIGKWAFNNCTSLTIVHFSGTESDWNNISIGSSNENLSNATRYYHDFSDWQVRTEPTCIENGEKYRVCSICGEEQTEIIKSNPDNHNFIDGVCSACKVISEDMLTYTVTDGKATITDVDDSLSGDVVIPNKLGGYPVVSIGEKAFFECYTITGITIPESVTNIGTYAFSDCYSLESITIPESITSISAGAFSWCVSLTDIVIPDSVTNIGEEAFYTCAALTSITIPESVTSIGSSAFSWCAELTDVTVPDSVTSLGEGVFSYCEKLQTVTLGNGVTSIGYGTFFYCENLTNVTIGSKITSIGEEAFSYCSSLESLNVPENITSIHSRAFFYCTSLTSVIVDDNNSYYSSSADGVLFNKNKTKILLYPVGKNATSYTIPHSVTYIGEWAFYYCETLTDIIIPDSVTYIGEVAFYACTNLTNIAIPDSVTSIGNFAFRNCENLQNVYYCGTESDWNNIDIGDDNANLTNATRFNHNFSDWQVRTEPTCTENGEKYRTCCLCGYEETEVIVTIYGTHNYVDGVCSVCKFISEDMLTYTVTDGKATITDVNTSLSGDVVIPDKLGGYPVTSIGDNAFSDCYYITNITIPNYITSIGSYAFSDCYGLTSITIPDSITSISDYTFSWCAYLTSITIPDSVTSIGNGAFESCISLTDITIPNSVTNIGNVAFSWCTNLTDITIPDSVTSLGEGAFSYCEKLQSVTLGNGVTSIENQAFFYCKNLMNITIGSKITSIGEEAFSYCYAIESINIPKNVTSISNRAFFYCTSLTSVIVDDNNSYYSSSADGILFNKNKTKLLFYPVGKNATSYTIPHGVTYIGEWAFYYCETLTDIIIPDSVTYIGDVAFYSCTNLTSIAIPDSVTSIGNYVFRNCGNLETVYYCGTASSWNNISIGDDNANLTNATRIYHNFSDWYIRIQNTCTEDGEKYRTCQLCGYEESEIIYATGHDYSEFVTDATCINEGYTTYTCENCGDSYTDNFTDATGIHIYENGNCTMCNAYLESEHDYPVEYDETWVITRKGAKSITITFSEETFVEVKYDFIYIYDADDKVIGKYNGDELAGQSVTVNGDTAKIRLYSDRIIPAYGFKITDISAKYDSGDVNADGEVDVRDLVRLKKILADLDDSSGAPADVNNDGELNSVDLSFLRRIVSKEIIEIDWANK